MVLNNAKVLDIKGNSLDDGPGIRTVIFFKGCNLNCHWCQNPETKSAQIELSYELEKCIGCRNCENACSMDAISPVNFSFVNRKLCKLCFECVEECPSTALSKVGKEMSIDEIFQKVMKYKSFYDTSGGGVTLSGGEPTYYIDFISNLLKKLKSEGIHTLIETNGLFNIKKFESIVSAIY